MSKKNLNIALKLEGPASEKGLVRLDDFLRELTALREALEAIDREINGKSTLYYRVVNLSHRSPAKVVIEPVLKQKLKTVRMGNRWGHLPEQIHHSFFETVNFIRDENQEQVAKISEPVIDAIASLLEGLGTDFKSGSIANSKLKFKLDDTLKERVEKLLTPEFHSYGSVEGQLLALNVAKGNRFYIYPEVGARSISCQFPEEMFEKAQGYIRKNVRVYGTKHFRESTGFPFSIRDVKDIELLEPSKPFPEFRPSPIKVIGKIADELIRESREEWG
ncbi:MAG TPA: hypothetical protein VGO57_17455 [Verrucomicrobiae bacterium]|jgi:hypothetical protein